MEDGLPAEVQPVASAAESRIAAVIARIPAGRVSTYGTIALMAGLPGRARLVGAVLKNQPDSTRLPWYRVVNAGGRISFLPGSHPYKLQRAQLVAEGVVFYRHRIDLGQYGWPQASSLDEALWSPAKMRDLGPVQGKSS